MRISTHLTSGTGKAPRLFISTPAILVYLLPLRSSPQPAKASDSPRDLLFAFLAQAAAGHLHAVHGPCFCDSLDQAMMTVAGLGARYDSTKRAAGAERLLGRYEVSHAKS